MALTCAQNWANSSLISTVSADTATGIVGPFEAGVRQPSRRDGPALLLAHRALTRRSLDHSRSPVVAATPRNSP